MIYDHVMHIMTLYEIQIDLQVVSVPEGTGKMIDMLEKEEVDVAITVADALIVARNKSKHIQLIGTWVESPLTWAVASSPKYTNMTVKELVDANGKLRVGISRLGSGSHTMANYLAMLHDIDASLLEFHVANNITGLREGIKNDLFDVFLWETFTTKVYFDSGELIKVGFIICIMICLIRRCSWKMLALLGQPLSSPPNRLKP
jgi:hypothetical protein